MTQLVWMRAGVLMMRARRVKTAPVTALLQCLHKSDGVQGPGAVPAPGLERSHSSQAGHDQLGDGMREVL